MLALAGAAIAFRPATSKLDLNRAASSVAMPVVAAGIIFASATPVHAAATRPSTGEQIFQGNCAACHMGGQNVIMPMKTLELAVRLALEGASHMPTSLLDALIQPPRPFAGAPAVPGRR